MPEDVRELCRLADIHSKSVLLQVVRQGNSQKMIAFLERLQQEGTTRADARRLTQQSSKKKTRGRPKNYVFNYAPKGQGIALSLKFKRSEVERSEVIEALEGVLEMLSGRYPSHELADLRPRLRWDRAADVLSARPGAAMTTRMNAGTIPDRGAFGVHLGEDGPRVGELDEEMVFETRAGDNAVAVTANFKQRAKVLPAIGAEIDLNRKRCNGIGGNQHGSERGSKNRHRW